MAICFPFPQQVLRRNGTIEIGLCDEYRTDDAFDLPMQNNYYKWT